MSTARFEISVPARRQFSAQRCRSCSSDEQRVAHHHQLVSGLRQTVGANNVELLADDYNAAWLLLGQAGLLESQHQSGRGSGWLKMSPESAIQWIRGPDTRQDNSHPDGRGLLAC